MSALLFFVQYPDGLTMQQCLLQEYCPGMYQAMAFPSFGGAWQEVVNLQEVLPRGLLEYCWYIQN